MAEAQSSSQAAKITASDLIIAIPTLNEEAHIETCLTSLMIDDEALQEALFVVADGGSKDRTCAIVREMAARRPNLELIDNPDRLQSAAINLVATSDHARGRACLIRCDAHAIYPADFITSLAGSLSARDAASIVVPMDAAGQTCFARGAAWVVDTPLGSGGASHRGGRSSGYVDHGHHAAFATEWFRRIEGYDPSFSHNEDAEFDHRLREAGGKIWLDADIRLTYLMRDTAKGLARQYANYGRGRMRTLRKHGMRPRLRQVLPLLLLAWVVLSLIGGLLIHPILFAGAAAYALLLALTSLVIAGRRASACGLWAGPALGIMHLSWGLGALQSLLARKA